MRQADISRNTLETQVRVRLDLDGSGQCRFASGVPVLDHMLEQVARHGQFDLEVEAKGDLHEKEEEVPKEDINLDKELGKKPDISWNIEKGADAVNGYKVEDVTNSEDGNKQTLKLKKEEETTAEMTAEDIAKLVDAEKPTVNPDGTYTLTRTETILDAEGNPQTRTTYITIQGSKVTTKTTTELTITREKVEHNEEASIPTDVVLPDVKLNNNETLSHTKLDEMLKEKGGKDAHQ